MDSKTKEHLIGLFFYRNKYKFLQLINNKEETLSKMIKFHSPDCSVQWFTKAVEDFIEAGLITKEENKGRLGKPIKLTDKGKEILKVLEKISIEF